jgi:uncharacterized protein
MTRVLLALAILFLPLAAAQADEVPIPPAPTRWATDTAGFMSPLALQAADRMLEDFERATGNQILVWIGRTTGDTPLEDWTIKAFERWKVGRQGLDNGLIFFVFADDRKARIEVGYGLEDKVPDALGSRILNDEIIPRIRAGDHDGAVLAGINGLRAAISGGDSSAAGSPVPLAGDGAADGPPGHGPRERSVSLLEIVIGGVVVVGFLILLVTNPSLALYILFSILSSGGGGRGGGGGFSGGGGRSGGGGASGSW